MEYIEEAGSFTGEDFRKMALAMCKKYGHMPRAILADNGFTYEHICARCKIDL